LPGSSSCTSLAAYFDIEADLTDQCTLGVAGRYEDFSVLSGRPPARSPRGTSSFQRSPSADDERGLWRAPLARWTRRDRYHLQPWQCQSDRAGPLPVTDPATVFFGAVALTPEEATSLSAGAG
jgi:iron complex outermembrane receptor protein